MSYLVTLEESCSFTPPVPLAQMKRAHAMAKNVNIQKFYTFVLKIQLETKEIKLRMWMYITIERFPIDYCKKQWGKWYLWSSRSWRGEFNFTTKNIKKKVSPMNFFLWLVTAEFFKPVASSKEYEIKVKLSLTEPLEY